MPHEHTTTSIRTRLLWTLGLATVGIGLTLALDSRPAHADTPTPATPILGSVGQLIDNTARGVVDLPAAVTEPADAGRPRPVRNLVTHTTRTVDTAVTDAAGTVRAVTDTADKTTRPLPVLGETVDQVTDLTDTITGSLPTLTPPARVDTAPTPNRPSPAVGGGSDDTNSGGTAPGPGRVVGGGEGGQDEDAPGATPVPHGQAAAPGAHHPSPTTAHTTRKPPQTTAGQSLTSAQPDATPGTPAPPGSPDTILADHTTNTDGKHRQTIDGDDPSNWPHSPTWHHHPNLHQTGLGGRTLPPPAPSG